MSVYSASLNKLIKQKIFTNNQCNLVRGSKGHRELSSTLPSSQLSLDAFVLFVSLFIKRNTMKQENKMKMEMRQSLYKITECTVACTCLSLRF